MGRMRGCQAVGGEAARARRPTLGSCMLAPMCRDRGHAQSQCYPPAAAAAASRRRQPPRVLLPSPCPAAHLPMHARATVGLQVGISSVWWEGNPCNMHLNDLAAEVKAGVAEAGMVGLRFNTIGVR